MKSFMVALTVWCAAIGMSSGGPAAAPDDDRKVVTPFYEMHFSQGLEEEAGLLGAMLDGAISRLCEDFRAADAERLLRAARVDIFITAAPNERAGIGRANCETGVSGGRYSCRIDLLAPSAHRGLPDWQQTSAGEPFDAAYCQKVLVHEYSTVLLESITRDKGAGWGLFSAPSWFVQGAEEYLGLMYSTAHSREVTLRRYVEMTRDQGLVRNDFGLEITSPYVAGPVLVRFMEEHYGAGTLTRILRSPEPTFGKAIRSVVGEPVERFFAAWEMWLAGQGG